MIDENDIDRIERYLNICMRVSDLLDEENVHCDVEYLDVFATFLATGIKNDLIGIEDLEIMINHTADIVQLLYKAEDRKLEDQS